jgi:hypothetical protein
MMNFNTIGFVGLLLTTCFMDQAHAQKKVIDVSVSKNIELISTLNNQISTEFLKDSITDPFLYKTTRVMRLNYEHFKSFSNHSAIRATQQMSDRIGTGVYLLGLFYNAAPDFTVKTPVSELIMEAIHPNADSAKIILDAYMDEVKKFYFEASFEDFYRSNEPLYRLAISEGTKNLPGNNFIQSLENYFGASKDGYSIILMPSFKTGWGMSWPIENGGKVRCYYISAPFDEQQIDKNGVVLNAGFDNAAEMRNLAVHEFGHSFVNPLTTSTQLGVRINEFSYLFQAVTGQGQYTDWMTLFNEHVVRAAEIRIALVMGNEQESKRLEKIYREWMYLPHFVTQLKRFENDRARYKTFESFLPELISSLEDLKN